MFSVLSSQHSASPLQGLALSRSLTKLDLEKKAITAAGVAHLATALASAAAAGGGPPLSHLLLSRSAIRDDGVAALAAAGGRLEVLEACDCGIRAAGLASFCAGGASWQASRPRAAPAGLLPR